jgi:hypothetical protein
MASIPGVSEVLANKTRAQADTELLIVVTPQIVALPPASAGELVLKNAP